MGSLKQLIEGKSVAIVGRAAYLAEKQQGEFIDSHDVVVRVHCNIPHPHQAEKVTVPDDCESFVPLKFQRCLGTKTDAFAPTNLAHLRIPYIDTCYKRLSKIGCGYIIQHKFYNVITGPAVLILDYIADNYMSVYVAPVKHFMEVSRQMEYAFPLPGTLLIYELLKMQPRSLYATGFTCFQDSTKLTAAADAILVRNHKPVLDLRFLRDTAQRDERFSIDSEMHHYFNNAI